MLRLRMQVRADRLHRDHLSYPHSCCNCSIGLGICCSNTSALSILLSLGLGHSLPRDWHSAKMRWNVWWKSCEPDEGIFRSTWRHKEEAAESTGNRRWTITNSNSKFDWCNVILSLKLPLGKEVYYYPTNSQMAYFFFTGEKLRNLERLL